MKLKDKIKSRWNRVRSPRSGSPASTEASEPRRSQQTDPSVANLPVEPSTTGGLLAPPLQLHEIRHSETSLLSSASGEEETAHSEQERDNSASILDSEEQAQPTTIECEESERTRAFIETIPVRENKATGRDLWREAFETLPESTQAKLHTNGVQAVAPLQKQIHDLLETTKARQKECEEKFWKFRVGNHEYVLRDYTVRIADCLQVIGNTAIKFAPPQASGPWVVIEALLKTVTTESAQMCALLATVEKIVRVVNRGQVYELAYTGDNTSPHALENIRSALVNVYATSLKLIADSNNLYAKNTAARTFYAILHPGETKDLISELSELETTLNHEVQVCGSVLSAEMLDEVRRLDAPLTRIDERVGTLLDRIDDKEQLDVLDWISEIPFKNHHDTVTEDRTPKTCEWLLQREQFREWEDGSSSVVLWLQGSPGTGKTFLTSRVVDQVQQRLEGSPNHEGLAYFYCNRNEESRRKPVSVLQSFVRQLSAPAGNEKEIQKHLRTLYYEARKNGRADLSFDTCKKQIMASVNLYPKTTLVLDALDECEPDSRVRLIELVEHLLSESQKPVKIFIASRPDGDIRDRFQSKPNISIYAKDNWEDIAKFVEAEMPKNRLWAKMSLSLQERVINTLIVHSDGMFQWAYLQTKQLRGLRVESSVIERLGRLPFGLQAAYDEIYQNIAERGKQEKVIVDRALMWTMCACEPLGSDQLLGALRLNPDDEGEQIGDEVDEDLLLELCNNLLVLDSVLNVWRFSHLSVREYLENSVWNIREAHCYASKVCLTLLNKASKKASSNSGSSLHFYSPEHPSQTYAQLYWVEHVQAYESQGRDVDTVLARELKRFLGSPSKSSRQYRLWLREVGSPGRGTHVSMIVYMRELSPARFPILAMCRFSLYSVLSEWWIREDIPIFQRNDGGQSLLAIAARSGSKPICELLIRRGLPVDETVDTAIGNNHLSALSNAAGSGRLELVKFLLDEGADINLVLPNTISNALMEAAGAGSHEIAKFLIENGADVDLTCPRSVYGGALMIAALQKDIKMTNLLIDNGADVNLRFPGQSFESALVAAVGSLDIVKRLVEQGADVNMADGRYGTPLAAAIAFKNNDCVEYLISQGADVHATTPRKLYGDALSFAVWNENEWAINLLVGKGVDVNKQFSSCYLGSALIVAAALRGRLNSVRILLESGAEPNMPLAGGRYGSALAASAECNNIDVTRLLVESGAKVDMPLQVGCGSALAEAASEQSLEIIDYLIEQGADVNLQLGAGDYGSALAAATSRCYRRFGAIERLIRHGAKVNTQLSVGRYGSALAAAASMGNLGAIRCLLKHGAELNMQLRHGKYGSALAAAARARKPLKTIKYLVGRGAEVNMNLNSGDYGSALAAAAYFGNIRAVKYLASRGATVDAPLQGGQYGSACTAAAAGGADIVLRYIIQVGADPNRQLVVGEYGTPLIAAAYWGEVECAKILLDSGARVDLVATKGDFGTALRAAQIDISKEDCENKQTEMEIEDEDEPEDAWKETRRQCKAEIAELLVHHGTAD